MSEKRFDRLHVTLLILLAIVVTAGVSVWVARAYLFPAPFEPVELSQTETRALERKLDRLGADAPTDPARTPVEPLPEGRLEPQPYSEAGSERTVSLSERELNALLARNPEMARRLAVDLSQGLASLNLLVPVDPDFPFFSGKIIRVRAGVELSFEAGKPVVRLRGVSIMGVPLPNAWLGGLKNIDLVREFGQDPGFWQSFAAGIEALEIGDGALHVRLRE
jgi:hypothetical protein